MLVSAAISRPYRVAFTVDRRSKHAARARAVNAPIKVEAPRRCARRDCCSRVIIIIIAVARNPHGILVSVLAIKTVDGALVHHQIRAGNRKICKFIRGAIC